MDGGMMSNFENERVILSLINHICFYPQSFRECLSPREVVDILLYSAGWLFQSNEDLLGVLTNIKSMFSAMVVLRIIRQICYSTFIYGT